MPERAHRDLGEPGTVAQVVADLDAQRRDHRRDAELVGYQCQQAIELHALGAVKNEHGVQTENRERTCESAEREPNLPLSYLRRHCEFFT